MSSSKIKRYLKNGDLSSAMKLLSDSVKQIGNYELSNSFDEIQLTYRAMLSYMLQGYLDNEYNNRREEIISSLFAINDQIDRYKRIATDDKQSRYISTLKYCIKNTSLENLSLQLEVDMPVNEHADVLCTLFNYVWTSSVWTKSEYEISSEIINSAKLTRNDKCVLISAITLSLMEMFDKRKVHFLFDAYLHADNFVNQRALVGIILCIRMYDSRLECYPDIITRIELFSEDSRFINETFDALKQLQYSSITDRVNDKMQNTILPQFINKKYEIGNRTNEEIMEEMTRHGENPEWTNDKTLNKTIKEMGEMMLEGADIYMSTFRFLKGYPFFNKLPHWFFLFNRDLISDSDESKSSFLKFAKEGMVFCDSDLYSFSLMFDNLGNNAKEMVHQQIDAELQGEDKIELLNNMKAEKNISNRLVCKMYIFNLYRFFVCYPFCNQFKNPFKEYRKNIDGTEKTITFSPLESKSFSFLLSHRDDMLKMADFYMRHEFYEEALRMFAVINPEQKEDDANIWQKIGFCKQKLGKEKSAYKTYLLVDSLLPNSNWTMRHIATLAMKLDNYDVALNYYEQLLVQDDENLKFIINKAICQMKMNEYRNAISTLYKADYLEENTPKINRMMVECYIHEGQYDKAAEKTEPMLSREDCPDEMRIINALLMLHKGDISKTHDATREAISFYEAKDSNGQTFINLYDKITSEYCDEMNIDITLAKMILDSVYLDI